MKKRIWKIGGILQWEEVANLIFCETNDSECSNKELRQLIMDEWSAGNAIAAMLFASENKAEVVIFAIIMRNQMIAGEALQMLMLCVMQSIK